MPTPFMMAVDFLALAVGAGLGWWRARFTHISVDPQTHQLTSKASPVGMLIILGIYAAKTAINAFARENAAATAVADALLLVSVGTVCAQRFELFTRASRLLAEARATKAQGEISA
jgi:hypothetical protein